MCNFRQMYRKNVSERFLLNVGRKASVYYHDIFLNNYENGEEALSKGISLLNRV